MKKVLSFILTLAMALTFFVVPVSAEEGIKTEADLISAVEQGGTIVLGGDIELSEEFYIKDIITPIVINGNGYTITAGPDFIKNIEGQVHLMKIENSDVVLNNITLKTAENDNIAALPGNIYQHALDIYNAEVELNNVTLDHTNSARTGAPLNINGGGSGNTSSVTSNGTLTLITGGKSWYAAGIDGNGGLAALSINDVIFEGDSSKAMIASKDATVAGLDKFTINGSTVYAHPAAKIDGIKYLTFAEAIAAANVSSESEVKVTLLKDIELGENIKVTKDITIEGDYTITRKNDYSGSLFTIDAGVTLSLNDVTIDGANNWIFDEEGYFTAVNDSSKHQDFAFVTSAEGAPIATADMFVVSGNVIANNVTIKNHMGNSNCNVFGLGANSSLTLNGTTITHNASPFESTVVAMSAGSTMTINDGTVISQNYAGRNGGVSRNNNGTIVMNGGSIRENYAVNTNGTVFMLYGADSMFEMKGGEICSNTGTNGPQNGRNSAIYMHTGSKMKMTGGKICCNTGTSYGGVDAPYTGSEGNASTVEISGGEILDNLSVIGNTNKDVNGGSAFVISGGSFTQDVSQWCTEGFGPKDAGNGVYIVHEHEFKEVAKTTPKCESVGIEAHYECSKCDTLFVLEEDEYVETTLEELTIPATGHTKETLKAVSPTCTKTGLTEGTKCSVCGEVIKAQTVVEALGHTKETLKAVAATCDETGLTEGTKCSVCNEILKAQEVVKALGHKEKLVGAKEATTEKEGYTGDTVCEVCEEVLEEGKIIPVKAQTTTGDNNMVVYFAMTAMLSASILVLLKKREQLIK